MTEKKAMPDIDPHAITPNTPATQLLPLLPGTRDNWPQGWAHWPNVAEAHRIAFRSLCADHSWCGEPTGEGRGIVICSGGWRFIGAVYVNVKLIRWLGCTLPIEIWYIDDSEYDPKFGAVLRDISNLRWVNASQVAKERGINKRMWGGWELKPFSVKHSSFREVLSLDADSYPERDPTYLFDEPAYRSSGAIFWPDNARDQHGAPLKRGQWERLGVPYRYEPDFESGQLLVNKDIAWHGLCLTDWLCDHSDYFWRSGAQHYYGDKSLWHLGWRGAGLVYTLAPPLRWHEVAFRQHDLQGACLFVHRCRDKPRLPEAFDYPTEQRDKSGKMKRINSLPHEWFVHERIAELDARLFPERHGITFRPGTWDKDIWIQVTEQNEYQLDGVNLNGGVVIDLGANIGAFVYLAAKHGASEIIAVEPDAANMALLEANCLRFAYGVEFVQAACWRSDTDSGQLTLGVPAGVPRGSESGNLSVVDPVQAIQSVPTVKLDEILSQYETIEILKIDVEGAEYAILYTSKLLTRVRRIVGEYHPAPSIPDLPPSNFETLAEYLRGLGFEVAYQLRGEQQGLFQAWRKR